MFKPDVKLLLVNVFLAGLAAFTAALAVSDSWDRSAIAAAGYGALRGAVGLGSIYSQRLSDAAQQHVDRDTFG